MKIYNEVLTTYNDLTGQWETISEDSFEYNGPMALAQNLPVNAVSINTADTISDTIKITTGYFTDGDGTIGGDNIHTSSLSDSNENYYFNVSQADPSASNAETQFSVTFGHAAGSGSDTYGDSSINPNTLKGETQAIYNQLANILLAETEVTGGFKISANAGGSGVLGSGVRDDYIYAIVGRRDRFKDRLNKKSWTLVLSGSNSFTGGLSLSLTDDSDTTPATATPAGPRYNIVSGALGTVKTPATTRTYGWLYPERGIMVFSGPELSASIPGGYSFNEIYDEDLGISASAGSNEYTASSAAVSASLTLGSVWQVRSGSQYESGSYRQLIKIGTDAGVYSGSTTDLTFIASVYGGPSSYTGGVGLRLWKGSKTTDVTASFDTEPMLGKLSGGIRSGSASGSNSRFATSGFAPNLYGKGNPRNALRLVNCMRNVNGTSLRLRSEEDQTQENYFCRIRANDWNFSANPSFVSGSKNKIRNLEMHGNPTTFITGVGLYNSAGQLLAIAELSKPLKKNFASEATIKVKLTY